MVEPRPNEQELEVVVHRVVSPLDTGMLHGRGHGVLHEDRRLAVTFLLDQHDFQELRERIVSRTGEVGFRVRLSDVTAIDATVGSPGR